MALVSKFVKALALLALCFFTACDSNSDVIAALTADGEIIVSPDKPFLKDVLEMFVKSKTIYSKYSWSITPNMTCDEGNEAPKKRCRPQEIGEYEIRVDMENGNAGGKATLKKKITVRAKNSGTTILTLVMARLGLDNISHQVIKRSTDRSLDEGLPLFFQNERVQFDFTKSVNPGQIWIDLGTGFKKVEQEFSEVLNWAPKDYAIRMKATDEDGNIIAERTFFISIQCPNPTLVADISKVSLAHSATQDDQFTFHFAPGFVQGGKGNYEFRADVNGDLVQDFDWKPVADLAAYTVDGTDQTINGLKLRSPRFLVRDTECNAQVLAVVPMAMDIPHTDGILENNLPAQRPNFIKFVEARIRGSDLENPRTNLYYNAAVNAQTPGTPEGPVLSCTFNPLTKRARIETYMKYPLSEQVPPGLPANYHGFSTFEFTIGTYQVLGAQTHNILADIGYTTAFQGDGPPRRTYRKATCPLKVKVESTFTPTGGCTATPGNPSTGTEPGTLTSRLVGTFECATMPANEEVTSTISLTQGALLCPTSDSYNVTRACTPPPPPPPPPPVCGNGTREGSEACDDGNMIDTDRCKNNCTINARCGDGFLDSGEQCDDGNLNPGDRCTNTCTINRVCGDGFVDPGEQCDDGNQNNGDRCTNMCVINRVCGDGFVDPGEQCDDGNQTNGDRCSNLCQINVRCGDGIVDSPEQCDDGNMVDTDRCTNMCMINRRCGDGFIDPGEQCDRGDNLNGQPGSGCSAQCQSVAAVCGNGIKEGTEQCDLGANNGVPNSGCDSMCRPTTVCGNGIVEAGEECDHGTNNGTPADLCRADCTFRQL